MKKRFQVLGQKVAADRRVLRLAEPGSDLTEAVRHCFDLATEPRWGRQAGTFGSDPRLATELTLAYLAGLAPREELNRRAMDLLERTGVAELALRDVSEASGGQLQRVGICRALINEPTMLFGDEPTGALDSTAAAEIMDILGELNAEGTTIMLVTHDPKVAARASRVLYMVDGRIVGDRDQGRNTGTTVDLDQRHAALTEWLLARGF